MFGLIRPCKPSPDILRMKMATALDMHNSLLHQVTCSDLPPKVICPLTLAYKRHPNIVHHEARAAEYLAEYLELKDKLEGRKEVKL